MSKWRRKAAFFCRWLLCERLAEPRRGVRTDSLRKDEGRMREKKLQLFDLFFVGGKF